MRLIYCMLINWLNCLLSFLFQNDFSFVSFYGHNFLNILNFNMNTIFRKAYLSVFILISGLVLTLIVTRNTQQHVLDHAKHEFNLVCNEIQIIIDTRLHAHAQLLQTGSSLFAVSDTVTRKEWEIYNSRAKVKEDLPGIQGVGYSHIIAKNQLKQHIENIRREGFPNYTVKPFGDRETYTSIIYLEPLSGRNLRAFGYDMFSEPVRRKAMELARDSDMAILSGKVTLVQETNEDLQAGTLMYVPVYRNGLPVTTVEQRRNAIRGWVYSPYRMNDLMKGISGRWSNKETDQIHLQIYENDSIAENNLLFDSRSSISGDCCGKQTLTNSLSINFNGTKWLLVFTQNKEQHSFAESKEALVLFTGIALSILLFFLSISIFNTTYHAQRIAKNLTVELKESEERWKFAIEGADDGLWDWNLETNEIFFSQQWKRMLGYEEHEIANHLDEWIKRVHPDDIQKCKEDIQDHKDGKTSCYYNLHRILCKNGSYMWILARGKILTKDKSDKPLRMIGTHTDLTERKEIENQLIQSNIDKNLLISILAHDLKSPFNAILGFLNLVIENIRVYNIDKIEQQLNLVLGSVKNTYILLDDLLSWARAHSDKLPFEPQSLNFSTLAEEMIVTLAPNSTGKNISITYYSKDEIILYADKNMISTILRNLVANAIKFTNSGGRIEIVAEKAELWVIIKVSDNGVGIEPNIVSGLFDIYRFNSTAGTAEEKGTGFGLLLCKDLVEKHGGKIWVESEVGKGSDFKFSLPEYSCETARTTLDG